METSTADIPYSFTEINTTSKPAVLVAADARKTPCAYSKVNPPRHKRRKLSPADAQRRIPGTQAKGQVHVSMHTWSISANRRRKAHACFPPSYGLLWAEGLLKLLERWKLNQPAKEMKAISLSKP